MIWVTVLLVLKNTQALLQIRRDPAEDFKVMSISLTQQMVSNPLYCVCLEGDGTAFANDSLNFVMETISIPVADNHCLGMSIGILITENQINAISSVRENKQHFRCFILLVNGSLQLILDSPSLFTNISAHVVAANSSSVFHIISPEYNEFQISKTASCKKYTKLPNLYGQTLRIATFHCPPFSYLNNWSNDILQGSFPLGVPDGVEMAVFRAISSRLNFTWKIEEIKARDKWGQDINGSWKGGILGTISQNLADIAFCGIFVDNISINTMDLTIPWTHYCLTFLVPSYASSFRFAILRTFQPLLWFAILLATLGTTLGYWLLSHTKTKASSISQAMLTAIGMLSLSNFPLHNSNKGPLRPVIISWSIYCMLVATALSSSLVSHLTSPAPAKQLNTIRDLVEAGITWGQDYKPEETRLFNLEDPWHAKLAEQFQLETNQYERIARIHKGHYAILGGKLDGKEPYFMEEDTLKDTGLISNLHVMKECLSRQYAAMGLTKRSPLTEHVSRALHWLLETGLVEHWQADLVRDYGNPEIKMLFHAAAYKGPQKLTWAHLEDIFILLFIGLGISSVVFAIEICTVKFKLTNV